MSKRWEEINALTYDIAYNLCEGLEDEIAKAFAVSPALLNGTTEGGRAAQAAQYRRVVLSKLAEMVKEKSL